MARTQELHAQCFAARAALESIVAQQVAADEGAGRTADEIKALDSDDAEATRFANQLSGVQGEFERIQQANRDRRARNVH